MIEEKFIILLIKNAILTIVKLQFRNCSFNYLNNWLIARLEINTTILNMEIAHFYDKLQF
jgi:hypothetical protein